MKKNVCKLFLLLSIICFKANLLASPMLDWIKSNKTGGIVDRSDDLVLTIILVFLAVLFVIAVWVNAHNKRKRKK